MSKLFKTQEDLCDRIQKARVNFGKQSKDKITLAYLETRLGNLEQSWVKFSSTHEKIILETESSEFDSSSYCKNDVFMQVEEMYVEYRSKLKECISKLSVKSATESPNREDKCLNAKLPKITIPTFSGKYIEWASFKDLFVSLVHNNNGLDDVQKLHYLKGHLQGEAEQLLRHIPITAGNYVSCWTQLEKRYDNKRFLANCILKRFMNQKSVTSESSVAIKELLDVTNECLHALENLGIDVKSWDILVIFIISQKLDTESRKLWETKNNDSSGDLPKLIDFKVFLENRFRALECINSQNMAKPINYKNKNAMALHVTTTEKEGCPFCSNKELSNGQNTYIHFFKIHT